MDTSHYPEPMKDPDTHSPAYLHAKANRVQWYKDQITKLVQRLEEVEEEENGISVSGEHGHNPKDT